MRLAAEDDQAGAERAAAFRTLGLSVIERGWLSSNNIVFAAAEQAPATVVDTGYVAHAAQTVALVRSRLRGEALGRVVNTHLHSDHCGGNAALQAATGAEVWVPAPSLAAVRAWDEARLTYWHTGQRCDRFTPTRGYAAGETLWLGRHVWHALPTGGHDQEAMMLWQPDERVLISADALWQDRLAILFHEVDGSPAFDAARWTLDTIEALAPRHVIPGHGAPFSSVVTALAASRKRLAAFEAAPARHALYSARALVIFHMLEHRARPLADLIAWMVETPVFQLTHAKFGTAAGPLESFARTTIDRLVTEKRLRLHGDEIRITD